MTFNYDSPTITAIVPMPAKFSDVNAVDGLQSITLHGTNFGVKSVCSEDSQPRMAPSVQVSAIRC